MSTYGQLQTDIADEMNRSDLGNQINKSIQEAIRKYERRRFFFNEQRATTATIPSQEFYGLPDDFISDDSLLIFYGNSEIPLTKRNLSWIEAVNQPNVTGIPSDYCLHVEQLRLHPLPNDAYVMTLSYLCRLPELVNTTDANAWTQDAFDLIKATAKRQLYMHYLRNPEKALIEAAIERDAYLELDGETVRRVTTGIARSTTW